jgi:outer membrane protein OmpA-like peptidoglycan-associated protein/tetratricopeptide (TPR) repeat protein
MEIKRISTLIIAAFMLLPLLVSAQEEGEKEKKGFSRIEMIKKEKEVEIENLSPRKKYKLAKKLEKRGSNYNALDYYEQFHEKKPEKDKAIAKLANLNFEMRDYKAAQKWYELLLETNPDKYPLTNFYYGLTLKHNGEYEKAKEALSTFKSSYAGDDSEKYKDKAELEIKGCDLAISLISSPDRVLIENSGSSVNNPSSDFGPEFMGEDEILFSSFRADSAVAINELEDKNKDYKAKLFTSKNKGGTWQDAELFPSPLNGEEYHFGNPSLSPDGKLLYFTKCVTVKKTTEIQCDIYVSENKDGEWTEPKMLGENINDKKSNNTHPAISKTEDGDYVLYFSSGREDEENGKGGKDIYYATSSNGVDFKNVTNVGSINTEYDDVTPYYDNTNGILYFSSNGRVGMGGFDAYKAVGSKNDFEEPEHMGYPINSSVDDFYFRLKDNEKEGLIVSNRPGGMSMKSETCCDDIWDVTIIREIILKGFVVSNKDPKTPIPGADVNFFDVEGEKLTPIGNLVSQENEAFLFTMQPEEVYQVNVTKSHYHGVEEKFDVAQLEVKDTLVKYFILEEIEQKEIKLKRIYFAFDKSNLTKKSRTDLDSVAIILLENEDYTVDVTGHTDSKGEMAYNMRLGKRRAQSAANYLEKKGVTVDRMSLISKGETQPLLPNENPDGSDNPENRAVNRRVEFFLHSNDPDLEIKIVYPDNYEDEKSE